MKGAGIQKVTSVPVHPDESVTSKISQTGVKEKVENYDLMTAVMIELGPSEDAEKHSLLKLLDVLLAAEPDTQKKKDALEQEFEIPMTETCLSSIQNVMSGLGITAEQAMELLKIPLEERGKYLELLKQCGVR